MIFSPPPTPNGDLHLGHISGPYLAADILKRHLLQKGENALYITGSDENQSYVELKARQMQISPKVIANQFSESIQSVLKQYNSAPDFFYRPLYDKEYTKYVIDFFKKLFSSSALKTKISKQPYCEECNLWLFEAHMSGICPHCTSPCGGGSCETCGLPNDCIGLINSFCKYCKTKPVLKETKQIYLPLQSYSKQLKKYLESINLSPRLRGLVRDVLDKGLPDLPITHNAHWGLAAPFDGFENQKLCSWCEMAPGYLFALHKITSKNNGLRNFMNDPKAKITLFFGFDNAYFYTIIMPALFLAYNHSVKLPTEMIYNEFYLFDNLKFSKSRSHVVLAKDIVKKASSDVIRYYLSATRPEFERTQFSYSHFIELINVDLIDGLSSWICDLSSRITLDFDGVCPDGGEWTVEHEEFIRYLQRFLQEATQAYEPKFFSLANIVSLLRELLVRTKKLSLSRKYLSNNNSINKLEYQTSLVLELTSLKYYAIVCSPIMPEFSEKLFKALGISMRFGWDRNVRLMAKGTKIKNLSNCIFTPINIDVFELSDKKDTQYEK